MGGFVEPQARMPAIGQNDIEMDIPCNLCRFGEGSFAVAQGQSEDRRKCGLGDSSLSSNSATSRRCTDWQ